jgi:hypothetical protein
MATNFSQSTPKIILIVLSTIAIGNAAIFGTATQANAQDVKAGPIWNNADAKVKCPVAAAAVGRQWNGQWKTTIPGKASVCGLKKKRP